MWDLEIPTDQPGNVRVHAPAYLSQAQRVQLRLLAFKVDNLCKGFNRSVNDLVFRIGCYRGYKEYKEGKAARKRRSLPEWMQDVQEQHARLSGTMLHASSHSIDEIAATIDEYLGACYMAMGKLQAGSS